MTKETINQLTLPAQEKFFSTEKLRKSARAGTNLPDPTMAPYGHDPKAHYRHLFPALELPALFPPGSRHSDDHVSFESPNLEPHRLWGMQRVLKSTGSIYVHCDWHASHYIKCEMDKIFGYDNLRNEIVWHYNRWTATSSSFQKMHDMIFWYSKTADYKYNQQ